MQFTFLNTIKDTILPGEADVYGFVKRNVWQRFSNSIQLAFHILGSVHGGKAKTGFEFNIQNRPCPDSGCTPLAKKPHFDTQFESCQDGRKTYHHG